MKLNYSKIPEKYKVGVSSNDEISLYRGDLVDVGDLGIQSKALKQGLVNKIEEAIQIIHEGTDSDIRKLIDRHTDGCHNSPFVSATYNPEMAQTFATREGTTIYKIIIPADRMILDFDNVGGTGNSKELLILGQILPFEIESVKKDNSDMESELYFTESGREYIRRGPVRDSLNVHVKDSSNWAMLNL